VVHRDRLDVVRALVKRIDELDVAVAAESKGVGHLLADQIVDNDLRAIELIAARHRIILPLDFLIAAGPGPVLLAPATADARPGGPPGGGRDTSLAMAQT